MAEPFVFYFKPGEDGHPQVMYIADVLGECSLCRHEEIQRFYHSTPFHSLTFESLDLIADGAHRKTEFECKNCGEAVGPNEAREAALVYSFPDDAGLLRIWVHEPTGSEPKKEYQLVAGRRLDPQELPGWKPSEEQGPIFDELDEWTAEEVLGRTFNPKIAWRDIVEDWLDDPEGGAWTRAAPGYYLLVEETTEAAARLADEVEEPEFRAGIEACDLVRIPLAESIPRELVTHEHPAQMPGNPSTWLRPEQWEIIGARGMAAEAYVSAETAQSSLERTLRLGQLEWDLQESEDEVWYRNLRTPRDVEYPGDVSLRSILQRAVYTGITPGESARLTAEEIIGVLLRVWKPRQSSE